MHGIKTRSSLKDVFNHCAFVSHLEPKTIEEAENDYNWINAIQEELNQLERNNVWTLVSRSKNYSIIGTKWVYRNKLDEHENVISYPKKWVIPLSPQSAQARHLSLTEKWNPKKY